MISLSEAREIIIQAINPLEPVSIPLAEARGRILREEVHAPEDIPAFDRSAMDGYAIGADDLSERFAITGEIQPGEMPGLTLGRGECARIFTGAAIPAGAAQVLMQEVTRREEGCMIPLSRPDASNIRLRGEDARAGDRLLQTGTRLGAGELALLAQVGVTTVRVSNLPRVLHITTGNEIVPPDETPKPGQIRDSNSTLLAALLHADGVKSVNHQHCRDRFEDLVEMVQAHPEDDWEVLLISGGASVGDYDFGARALEALGFTLRFRKINVRPGKPLVFGTRGRQIAFVLPGNPVSHFVTYHLAVRLALEGLAGASARWPLAPVALGSPLEGGGDGRETWCPARIVFEEEIRAYPIRWQSSGDSCALAGATGLLRVPQGNQESPAGERVDCLWLQLRP